MRRRVLAVAGVVVLAGCSVVLGLDPPSYDGPIGIGDSSTDTGPLDSGPVNPPGRLDDPARWSTYSGAGGNNVAGPFDGRFVYFLRDGDFDGPDAGLTGSRILRYDTTATRFDDPASWTSFDPEIGLGTTGPHLAAILDGPWLVVAGYADGIFLRFNTRLPPNDFGFASSWQTFSSVDLGPNTSAYDTAVRTANDAGVAYTNAGTLVPIRHDGRDASTSRSSSRRTRPRQ